MTQYGMSKGLGLAARYRRPACSCAQAAYWSGLVAVLSDYALLAWASRIWLFTQSAKFDHGQTSTP